MTIETLLELALPPTDTWVVGDGSVGTIKVECLNNGDHWFTFDFRHGHSTMTHNANSTGLASVAFNDDPQHIVGVL